jgi:CHAD domain-containing protein
MPTEREYKFAVLVDREVPGLDDLVAVGDPVVVEQTAVYYDTVDLRLTRAGASLRHRSDDGWTVKLPVEGGIGIGADAALVRAEHPVAGPPGDPPVAARDLVAARVRTARLTPVARLHTTRAQRSLRTLGPADAAATDGADVGVLTDDRCRAAGAPGDREFREIELEVAPDAPAAVVAAVVARLRSVSADPDGGSTPLPKVARALGPLARAAPDVVVPPVGTPATVTGVLRHALAESVQRLVVHDPVARIGEDPEGVHQARVATRRLRSHLRTFRSHLHPVPIRVLRAELGWLAGELGAVRDADVLRDRLRTRLEGLDPDDADAAQPILDRIDADRAAARAQLLAGLRSPRYLALLDRLVAVAARPPVVPGPDPDDLDALRRLVRTPWRRLRRAVAGLPDPAPDAALHAIRIHAKRARYAAEVMVPVFGAPARDLARAVTRVQDVLGEHQDAVVAGAWLRTTGRALPDPRAAFAAGELAALERVAAGAARDAWPEAWAGANRPRLRRSW